MPSTMLPRAAGADFSQRRGHYDVVVVGAGIVGLGHAYDAWLRGLTVAVVDRASTISGSTLRNFGHIGVSAQSGKALEFAEESHARWRTLARRADFWLGEAGAVVAARAGDEFEALEQFHAERGSGWVTLLSPERIAECTPIAASAVVGGAWLSRDLQIDPRTAAPRIADWLASVGVDFFWLTNVVGVDTGTVRTARGDLAAGTVIVAVNYDVDWLYPQVAASVGIQRCSLEMISVRAVLQREVSLPLLTGWSLVRYSGFAALPGTDAVRDRLAREHPDLAELDLNQMYTQRPNGDIIIGDTHTNAATVSPFQSEHAFDRLLDITRELFGVSELVVRERWQGVYAKGNDEFLVANPAEGVWVVSVTTGIGMTSGLGLAASVMDDIYGSLAHGFVRKSA